MGQTCWATTLETAQNPPARSHLAQVRTQGYHQPLQLGAEPVSCLPMGKVPSQRNPHRQAPLGDASPGKTGRGLQSSAVTGMVTPKWSLPVKSLKHGNGISLKYRVFRGVWVAQSFSVCLWLRS